MRGLGFTFFGAVLGAVGAATLGILFGSGVTDMMAFEIGLYVFFGVLLGAALGGLAHIVTKGSGRLDTIRTTTPPKPMNKGAAVTVMLIGGLVLSGMSLMRMMDAPPGKEGYFTGSFVGGLVGTAIGIILVLRRKG